MTWVWDLFAENWGDWLVGVLKWAVGTVLGLVTSWFLVFRAKWKGLQRLKSGESDDLIYQMHRLYPVEGREDRFVLLFRNVAPKTTLADLYDNPQARSLVKDLGDRTSLTNPILLTEGRAGFEVLNDAFGHIAGLLATTPFQRDLWLFAMTCEDREIVRKRCVRCFLVRPDDLERFADWTWCRTAVLVERPTHWPRVVALHFLAKTWQLEKTRAVQREQATDGSPAAPFVDEQQEHERVRSISLGLHGDERPVSEPHEIGWESIESELRGRGVTFDG